MFSSRLSSKAARLFEHFRLTTDVARGLRSSLSMALAWVACLLVGQAAAAVLVATAAQNVAMPDLRGDYRARLLILLTLTVVISVSAFAGMVVPLRAQSSKNGRGRRWTTRTIGGMTLNGY
jgi:hypothetical protein